MSMQKMRENTKTILWLVVISFIVTIFAVWGMDLRTSSPSNDPNIIGRVNKIPISRIQYQQIYDRMLKAVSDQASEKEIPYSQREMIKEQIWNDIVYNILTSQAIEQLGIKATEEEIDSYLRNSPPPEIQQYFLDDKGNFDYESYKIALNNPEIDWSSLRNVARQRIPMQKLQMYLQAMIHVSSSEAARAYEEENTLLSAEYVEFPLEEVEIQDYNPAPDEINAYYENHKDEFQKPETAVLDIVAWDINPSSKDIETAKFTIDLAREQVLAGEDFADLAKTYSELPTAASGGETGFIKPGQRENEVFSAADSLKIGEISSPIKTPSGYYLIKLLARQTSKTGEKEYNLQEIFVRISAGYETLDSLRLQAQDLLERARTLGLKKAAEEFHLALVTTEPFMRDYPISNFGFVPKLNDFAFSSEEGSLSNVIRDDRRFYVASLAQRIPKSLKPLSEVKDFISRALIEKRKKDLAYERAQAFKKSSAELGFEEAAEKMGLSVHKLTDFHVNDNLEGLGSQSSIAIAAFSITEGSITPPISQGNAYYVIKLVKRSPFDREDYKKKMVSVAEKIYQEKSQRFINFWYDKLRKEAKVEDYRKEF